MTNFSRVHAKRCNLKILDHQHTVHIPNSNSKIDMLLNVYLNFNVHLNKRAYTRISKVNNMKELIM